MDFHFASAAAFDKDHPVMVWKNSTAWSAHIMVPRSMLFTDEEALVVSMYITALKVAVLSVFWLPGQPPGL